MGTKRTRAAVRRSRSESARAHDDLLIELLTEELPPKSLAQLVEAFSRNVYQALKESYFLTERSEPQPYATPRRLAVRVSGVLGRQPDRIVERRGPPVNASIDADGKPTQALLGFARSCGAPVDALEKRPGEKGEYFVYRAKHKGEPLKAQLTAIVESAINAIPVLKLMRWGSGEVQFVRPVHGLVMLHGKRVVPGEVLGLKSGRRTRGHRFLSSGEISIDHPKNYERLLERKGAVVARREKRIRLIEKQLDAKAEKSGGGCTWAVGKSAELIEEVANLVEYPVVYAGRFDEAFLTLPRECLILSMQQHQRYFPLQEAEGRLRPEFLFVANIKASDPEYIVSGNERVLKARLSDAKFFFENDKKTTLDARVPKLAHVVYHSKLGSELDRVERITSLAGDIARMLNADIPAAEMAARLCKADLLTGMVNEFPELEGIMGYHYAKHEGLPDEVAVAIKEHYMPRFANDDTPSTALGICVALADKLETLVGIYGIGLVPTGDKDPFGLRRHALGIERILIETGQALDLIELLHAARSQFNGKTIAERTVHDVYAFMLERLRSYLREKQFAPDELDAVLSLNPTRLDLVLPRIRALREFRQLPEAEALAVANKRIQNILKQAGETELPGVDASLLREDAELDLMQRLKDVSAEVRPLFAAGEYAKALTVLAALREPVDTFFDKVMVMVDDRSLRSARLSLLDQVRNLFLHAADISRLQS